MGKNTSRNPFFGQAVRDFKEPRTSRVPPQPHPIPKTENEGKLNERSDLNLVVAALAHLDQNLPSIFEITGGDTARRR